MNPGAGLTDSAALAAESGMSSFAYGLAGQKRT